LREQRTPAKQNVKYDMQVAAFMGVLMTVLIPVVAYPAYKAMTSDLDKEMRGAEAGFQKSGIWKEINK
jgi:bacteriorhodopsin